MLTNHTYQKAQARKLRAMYRAKLYDAAWDAAVSHAHWLSAQPQPKATPEPAPAAFPGETPIASVSGPGRARTTLYKAGIKTIITHKTVTLRHTSQELPMRTRHTLRLSHVKIPALLRPLRPHIPGMKATTLGIRLVAEPTSVGAIIEPRWVPVFDAHPRRKQLQTL